MENKVAPLTATPDSTVGQKSAPARTDVQPQSDPVTTLIDPADIRLLIEEDKTSGSYVYSTVDRMTGKTILQLPRKEILQLRENPEYAAGDVIRAKA
jgi:uncharacterized FlaG/YvyC family protein